MGYGAGTASILWPALAPVGSHRWPGKSMESAPFSVRWCLSFQGLTPEKRRSRRREPGPRQLGTVACQGKALTIEAQTSTEVVFSVEVPCHPCDPTSLRAEKRTAHTPSSTAGWIPQGGGRPRLWRFFPRFLIGEKSGPAERPRQAGRPEPRLGRRSFSQKRWKNLP